VLVATNCVRAQESVTDSVPTVLRVPPAVRSEPATDSPLVAVRPTKSAGTALLLSALLPGAGQVYNESYWKVPIIAGFAGYFIYEWIWNNNKADEYRGLYVQSIRENPPFGDDRYRQLREFYKQQRDSFAWYFVILYVLNLVDAYVDASLYDFDVGENLSLHLKPQGERLAVQLRF
jgi:hypothetical protein